MIISVYISMGDSFDDIKRNNSSAMGRRTPPFHLIPLARVGGGRGGGGATSLHFPQVRSRSHPRPHNILRSLAPPFSFFSSSPYTHAVMSSGTLTHFSNTDSYTLSISNMFLPPNHYPQILSVLHPNSEAVGTRQISHTPSVVLRDFKWYEAEGHFEIHDLHVADCAFESE